MTARASRRRDRLEREIEAALDPGRFISDRGSYSFVADLELVDAELVALVGSEPARAVALYEAFLAGCHEKAEELDDSSGSFGTFVGELFCGWVKARQAAGVCRTGYTGEDGVELLLDPSDAPQVWDALLGAGVTPCGLGARDTLRLEVCFHLYGNDIDESRNPIEAGLGWCCKEATGFIGADAVAAARAGLSPSPAERLVPFVIDGPGIARQGNEVRGGGAVTSGSFSPSLEVGIGMAYVPAPLAQPGTRIEIDVRGQVRAATVGRKPLYGGESGAK